MCLHFGFFGFIQYLDFWRWPCKDCSLSVDGACAIRDAEMRKACAAKDHPTKPEWLQSDKIANPTLASATPKPIVINYNTAGEDTNSQQVVQCEQVQVTKLPLSVCGETDAGNSWKHFVVVGLLAACKHFSEACSIDETTLEVHAGSKTSVSSKATWAAGALVLVPKVPGICNIALKSRQEADKNRMLVELVRAFGHDKACVLLPAIKLPRKGVDPKTNPDLWSVIPARLARRSTSHEECNMELQRIPLDSVITVGDGTGGACFAETHSIVLPVFSNSKPIQRGVRLSFILHQRQCNRRRSAQQKPGKANSRRNEHRVRW